MRKTLNSLATFLMIAATALLVACSNDEGGAESIDQCGALGLNAVTATAKIANGTNCTDLNKSPVVALFINLGNDSAAICSGTMITPNKVLTAAHCVENAIEVDVLLGVSSTQLGFVTTTSWQIDPNFSRAANGAFTDDIAVINVPVSLPLPTVPVLSSSPPQAGQKGVIFGYGTTGASDDFAQLRSGVMKIATVDSSRISAVYESSTSNVCSGDSGGPLLLQNGNQLSIAGITSYGDSRNCSVGERSVFMNVQSPSIQNFLRSVAPDARYL
jgi:secreted trypsin-like serine protease